MPSVGDSRKIGPGSKAVAFGQLAAGFADKVGVARIDVDMDEFRRLADELGFGIECPIPDPLAPGQTETNVPFEAVGRLEQISTITQVVPL